MIAEHDARAVDLAFGAAPRQRGDVHGRRGADVRRRRVIDDRLRDRVRRALLDRRGEADDGVRGAVAGAERQHVDHSRHAARQRPRLVEGDAADAAGALQVRAAFDQHALARRAGERGDDRHRRRDDERARARHDEQHQRAVDPRLPAAAERERRHDGDPYRQHDDGRRVDAREALDQRLGRRALRLRALDEMDDPRQRRVAAQPRDAHLERAAPVDGAREQRIAGRLVDRQRLAGDRRLVHRALSGDHLAVERHLLTRPDDQDRADRNGVDRHAPLAGRVADQRLDRRQVHQRADRVARAVERPRLEPFGDGEEEDHAGGFGILSEDDRARHRDHHQDVDVERARA